ncbi:hypothetical protein Clacol_009564 [Clathrus columnatus]|uniref:Uncharacterized protein n=1 Tax=Clathrus columnatus TaxID=1419009 RepID=A0AAV5AP63_9AGAM|nr:hypothetical protein Clacol_009564 [Clathrus columnatus]
MFNSKSTLLAQSVLLFASYASCQGDAAPNGTLYIPGISQLASVIGTPAGAVVASQVTVEGASTVFEIVDALPTAVVPDPLTGAHLSADAEGDGLGDIDINCSIAGDESSCQLSAAAAGVAFTSSFTEPTNGVPVVAINFASASSSASGSESGSSASGSSPTAGSSSSASAPTTAPTAASGVSTTPSASVSVTSSAASSNSGSSSSSSASSTAPAPSTSTTQPSSAMSVHVSMGTMLFGLIVAFSLASLPDEYSLLPRNHVHLQIKHSCANAPPIFQLTQIDEQWVSHTDVSCQGDTTPNGTLYIPGISQLANVIGTTAGAVIASQVTVENASTVYQIVDALPTAVLPDPLTATLVISPTGAHLSADAEGDDLGDIDINCLIAGGRSSCQLSEAEGGVSITSFFTEPPSGIPVVAVNFVPASGLSESSASSSSPTSPTPSNVTFTIVTGISTTISSGSVTSSTPNSNSGSSSASSTASAPAASTTQPSFATSVHVSMGFVFCGLVIALLVTCL